MLKTLVVIIKKTRTTSNVKPIICVSPTNEIKTQIGWVVVQGKKHKSEPKKTMFLPMGLSIMYLILTK
jgi:hypothetical protein